MAMFLSPESLIKSARSGVALLMVFGLGSCAPLALLPPEETPVNVVPAAVPVPPNAALSRGMSSYDDGDYSEAANQFRLALDQKLSPVEQTRARKHLAFAYCVTGKERLCTEEFRKLLEIHPAFELDPAEAGHPIWGPVFRRAKAKRPELKK